MPEVLADQAAGLRRMFGGKGVRVVTFVAAGEGVGKTHVVANLAYALARLGNNVLVLDENEGQDNIASLHGIGDGYDLLDVVQGNVTIDSVLHTLAPGLFVCPAARAARRLERLTAVQQEDLFHALADLPAPPDVVLVDALHNHPIGFSPFALASPETVVVLSGASHAITGAYSLIKQVASVFGRRRFRVLINKVRELDEANKIFENLSKVASQRGVANISLAGFIPFDEAVGHAGWLNQPVIEAFPQSISAEAFRYLARHVDAWAMGDDPGGLQNFMRHLLHLTQRIQPSALLSRQAR